MTKNKMFWEMTSILALIQIFILILVNSFKLSVLVEVGLVSCILIPSTYFIIKKFLFRPTSKLMTLQNNAVFAMMAEGLLFQDKSSKITFYNEEALKILDLTGDQLMGKTSLDPSWKSIKEDGSPFPGNEHPAIVTLATGIPQKNIIMGLKLPSGVDRWIKINTVPQFFSQGASLPDSVICTFSDITDVQKNRRELELANTRIQTAAEAVGFGVWDWNLKTGVLVWDPLMYKIFDIDQSNFNGDFDAFEKTLLPEDAVKLQETLQETFAHKSSNFNTEFRIFDRFGNIKYILGAAKCFYDDAGKIEKLIGFNSDITKKVLLKQQIENQRVQLVSQVKMATLGEMASGIAHEINNPLATIYGRARMLLKAIQTGDMDQEKNLKYIEIIINTSDRIAKIVSGLRTFSRNAEKDPMELTSLSVIIEDTLSLCQERFQNHKIALEILGVNDTKLNCRPTQLSQVLLNLLNNAFDAAMVSKNKWVKLEFSSDDSAEYILTITDSGEGIPSQVAEKIMHPFFTTKEVGKGTGLGLSISKNIIEDHGGTLSLDPNCPNTKFVIRLPLVI